MNEKQIKKHLNQAIEKQVPDVWDELEQKLHNADLQHFKEPVSLNQVKVRKRKKFPGKLSLTAAICLIVFSTLTFTPALAALQEVYEQLFSSERIDDTGVRHAIEMGYGKEINQTYYDEENDITVRFEKIMTDDKETKLLVTYQSDRTDLEDYSIDLFEGDSKIYLIGQGEEKTELNDVGWGSSYYDAKENKVISALSFESIKQFEGKDIRLEIEDLTIYGKNSSDKVEALWPLDLTLDGAAVSERESVEVGKEFEFNHMTYRIKRVEYSALETRIVFTGDDTSVLTDPSGMRYEIIGELESQFLNARKIDKEYGYIVDEEKSGVFLRSAGKRVDPIFSKGEVQGEDDELILVFAPVEDRSDTVLEVGEEIEVSLSP
ncbi:DUF4179 domain-containing protein [Jeotgalibacillus haloalkalitolerans]|uniref:DUF4179 domain-containing protein n=1 Tax=Jeotgalibacillus haloalkalitolerans TaxID=3104292 RepID=A0ABU5KN46_9BACL|nr:DUF4179 domain-containing protein [Jeotgalibacillus sp. HH7-29]MDZ5712687.1 DUF4179 domain-containing protein [Jeotgalibacillus sp. HH7-29]